MKKNELSHPEITKELLTEEWVINRLSQREIAEKYKVGLWLIESRIERFELTSARTKIKYLLNSEHVSVESPVFWYLMGLTLSDGHIDEKNKRISITLTHDYEILETLSLYYSKDKPIPVYSYLCTNNNTRYSLTLSDVSLINLFHSLGVDGYRKTYVATMPDPNNKEMFNLMLRGFIDGDGSIRYTAKSKQYLHFRFYIESKNLTNSLALMFKKYYNIDLYVSNYKGRTGFRVESPALKKGELIKIYSEFPDLALRRKRDIVAQEVNTIKACYDAINWNNWNH